MTSPPEVSVVVPAHNRADLLPGAVRSVLGQEGVELELIVVDDASTDDTPRVLESFGDAIRVVRPERNVERGAARNLGARQAKAPILAFLDSDDEWRPGKLAAQLPLARAGSASVTGLDFVGPGGRVLRTCAGELVGAPARVLLSNPVLGGASSLVIPRATFEAVGGYPEGWSVQGSEDWVLLVRLHRAGAPVEVIPAPLVRYLVHDANSTADPERFAVSMWSAVDLMEREGHVAGPGLARLRGRTAAVIARGFAAARRWDEAASWTRIAARQGSRREAARALALVPVSGARSLLRRAGV